LFHDFAAVDEDERFEIYKKIFTKVQEEAVFVVLYNKVDLMCYSDQLNVPTLPLEGQYSVSDFSWK
jgi:ABC-type transport system substrate-binding protein